MNHPTPWQLKASPRYGCHIRDARGVLFVKMPYNDRSSAVDIVTAGNAHHALLAAAKKASWALAQVMAIDNLEDEVHEGVTEAYGELVAATVKHDSTKPDKEKT